MTRETTGRLIGDRYRIADPLGRGGMADVYRATDEVLGRDVAIKVLREVADPVHRDRFVAEARVLAGLNHPGLVTLLDAGVACDRPYLVMALADGPTLASRITPGALSPDEVRSVGVQLADGLAYAHRQGVVHRDVKPSNVLWCEGGRVLLADFGIARLIGSNDQHTRTGDTIGSPAYLAPEQVSGEALTPAVDVYSLGLVLLEALTGIRAFPGSPVEAAVARLNLAPPMPTSLDPGWRDLLARMTHRDPAGRPTAEEVAAELGTGHATAATFVPQWSSPADRAPGTGARADLTEATGEIDLDTDLAPDLDTGPDTGPGGLRVRGRTAALVAAAALGLAVIVTALGAGTDPAATRPDAAVPDEAQAPPERRATDVRDTGTGASDAGPSGSGRPPRTESSTSNATGNADDPLTSEPQGSAPAEPVDTEPAEPEPSAQPSDGSTTEPAAGATPGTTAGTSAEAGESSATRPG